MVKLKNLFSSILSRGRDVLVADEQPECFKRLEAFASERKGQADVPDADADLKEAERKYAQAKRAMQREETTLRAFCNALWGVRSYAIYREPGAGQWVLESGNSVSDREAVLIEVRSPEKFAEEFGGLAGYEPAVYVHWHERRYMPIELRSLNKDGLAEALVSAMEKGGPFKVTRFFYRDWMCRT